MAAAASFPPIYGPEATHAPVARPRASSPEQSVSTDSGADPDGPMSYEAIGRRLYELGLTPRVFDGDKVRLIEVRALRKLAVVATRLGLRP